MVRKISLVWIAGGIAAATATAANAQPVGGPPAGAVPSAGPRSQDVAASNRQVDSDYNTLAGRGVSVTDKSRADSPRKHASAVPATAADIKAGARLRDINGVPIGTVVSSDADQAIVDTGETKIAVPLIGFGKDDQGLLLNMTAQKFHQLLAQAQASAATQARQSQP